MVRKIHLYACLSTAALLIMFIFTSYLMIHHDWFEHEPEETTETVILENPPANIEAWDQFEKENEIHGRMEREFTNGEQDLVREYGRAAGFTRVTILKDGSQAEIFRSDKTTSDAIIGIHRQRGYGGPWHYSVYALLLDILAVSMILFTVTGIILWLNLLKNSKIAWGIFIGGFLYVLATIVVLMFW